MKSGILLLQIFIIIFLTLLGIIIAPALSVLPMEKVVVICLAFMAIIAISCIRNAQR